jgi:osmoprotectant transport system ATP-binding protein
MTANERSGFGASREAHGASPVSQLATRNSQLVFQNVSKRFPGAPRAAVDDCSFAVDAGAFVVLLGPSGCGKTTLLKMVNRLYDPSAGTIRLGGVDVATVDAVALRRQIGYVIQQAGLFPHLTVADNVAVVPRLLGWDRARIRARVDELLELVRLDPAEYRGRYPSQLSGGQQQRVGLARALAANPGLLLMDEPFGAIDAITRAGLQEEMLRLRGRLEQTVLFVTHDVEEALRLADRIVVMREGHVVQYDMPFALVTQPADDFVRELVGADDVLRRLGLLRVDTVMAAPPAAGAAVDGPSIAPAASLRDALAVLLRTGAPALTVEAAGRPLGVVDIQAIRSAAGGVRV